MPQKKRKASDSPSKQKTSPEISKSSSSRPRISPKSNQSIENITEPTGRVTRLSESRKNGNNSSPQDQSKLITSPNSKKMRSSLIYPNNSNEISEANFMTSNGPDKRLLDSVSPKRDLKNVTYTQDSRESGKRETIVHLQEIEDEFHVVTRSVKRNNSKRLKLGVCDGEDGTENLLSVPKFKHSSTISTVSECPNIDWENWPTSYLNHDPLTGRLWKSRDDEFSKINSFTKFTIMTYNILSETLLKNSHCFGNIKPENWSRTHRHSLLIKEIVHIEAGIVCMQEVDADYLKAVLGPALERLDYGLHFSCNVGMSHGLLLAFNKSQFSCRRLETIQPSLTIVDKLPLMHSDYAASVRDYLTVPEVGQIAVLQVLSAPNCYVCVGNVHISYVKHQKPDLRCIQATQMLWTISQMIGELGEEDNKAQIGWILCGDFNSKPDSMLYQIVQDGYPSDETILSLGQQPRISPISKNRDARPIVDVIWPAFQHPMQRVGSAYQLVLGSEPPLTQNVVGNAGCLDYIWTDPNRLAPNKVLMPPCEYLRDHLDELPDNNLPSDHTSLVCEFVFRKT